MTITQAKCSRSNLGGRKILSSPDPLSASADATSWDELYPVMQFAHISRESDVRFFAGLESTKTFKAIFDYLLPKSSIMMYWEGPRKAAENSSKTASSFQARINVIIASPVYSEENVLPINIHHWPHWSKNF